MVTNISRVFFRSVFDVQNVCSTLFSLLLGIKEELRQDPLALISDIRPAQAGWLLYLSGISSKQLPMPLL